MGPFHDLETAIGATVTLQTFAKLLLPFLLGASLQAVAAPAPSIPTPFGGDYMPDMPLCAKEVHEAFEGLKEVRVGHSWPVYLKRTGNVISVAARVNRLSAVYAWRFYAGSFKVENDKCVVQNFRRVNPTDILK
jgi:hypothetical protein